MTIVRIAHAEPRPGKLENGGFHTEPLTEQGGLRLEIFRQWRAREDHGVTLVGGHHDWSGHEITALIPEDALIIRFGVTLTGTGGICLRNPALRIAEPGHDA